MWALLMWPGLRPRWERLGGAGAGLMRLRASCWFVLNASPRPGRGGGARESAVLSGGRSSRGAALAAGRADTLDRVPELADALEAGETSADHVDALTRAGSGLSDDKRDVLFADVELSGAARRMGPDPFATEVKRKARLLAKDEGEDKLQQQQNATNLRKWVRKDGMHVLNGEFDPETGSRLFRAIDTETETLAQTQTASQRTTRPKPPP